MNKISVYAICKNESAFVDRWYKSMEEADEIIVVDTGSTDDTIEKLKSYKKIKVIEKVFNPWRFDDARNFALSIVGDDMNILVSTDLDEILEPGWAEILRREWIEDYHTRAMYKYAWSHNTQGDPARIMLYDKIHDRSWYWKYPVHEALVRKESPDYTRSECLDVFEKIYLHHYPDQMKSRKSYLPLLEIRAKEDNKDWFGAIYLAHEYFYQYRYADSIYFIDNKILQNKSEYTALELSNIYYFRGCNNIKLERYDEAIADFNKGISVDSKYRENYLKLADLYNTLRRYNSAIGVIRDCLSLSERRYSWLERDTSWNEEPWDILSISYYYIGEYITSYNMVIEALEKNTNSRLLENKRLIENKLLEQKEEYSG